MTGGVEFDKYANTQQSNARNRRASESNAGGGNKVNEARFMETGLDVFQINDPWAFTVAENSGANFFFRKWSNDKKGLDFGANAGVQTPNGTATTSPQNGAGFQHDSNRGPTIINVQNAVVNTPPTYTRPNVNVGD